MSLLGGYHGTVEHYQTAGSKTYHWDKAQEWSETSEWVMEWFSTFLGQLKICIYTMTKCPHDIVNWLVQSPSKCFNRGAPCIWCFLEAATHYHHIYPSIHHLNCWFIGMSTNGRVKKKSVSTTRIWWKHFLFFSNKMLYQTPKGLGLSFWRSSL